MQSAAPLVALATAVVLACATLAGQDKGVKASNAWIRLPAGGDTEATAFVTIENPGMYEVNVTGAKSDAAGKVELRDGGQSVTFINVPPYGRVDMAPGGIHLLLIGLKQPLRGGDTVALVLSTDVDVTLTVSARVREP